MLERLPESIGHALERQRAGIEQITLRKLLANRDLARVAVTSSAFQNWDRIPISFTADGPGMSPPIEWRGAPETSACVALIVEDADSPTPQPLVHAIAVLEGGDGALDAGALASPDHAGSGISTGRNSYLQHAWLPPDPPPGHGDHRYVFQVFALNAVPDLSSGLGRRDITAAVMQHAVAVGCLVGIYAREHTVKADEETPEGREFEVGELAAS
jgi:Raf kinase inhibitor-like YbhB/YbcL family protein